MTFGPLIYYYLWNPEVYASKIDRTTIFRPDLELALGKRLFRNYVAFHLPVAANRLYYVYTPYLGLLRACYSPSAYLSAHLDWRDGQTN